MKLSKRLEAIASFINKKDKVCDVGCDHGYLDIYLALNKGNKTIIASDISEKVINNTIDNIKKYDLQNIIKVYCTDGTKNIKEEYDTLVISGLGAYTILKIINESPKVNKLIISSNNNWDLIRKNLNRIGYGITKEKLVYENKKLYSIIIFQLNNKKLSRKERVVGKYNASNRNEYKIYLNLVEKILKSIPCKYIIKRIKYKYIIKVLNNYLMKEDRIISK